MADDSSQKRTERKEVNDRSDYDPELDFFSHQFNPLKALASPNLVPPVTDAKTYDNIAIYQSNREGKVKERGKHVPVEPKAGTSELAGTSEFQRKWLPHQFPVKSERKIKVRNIFTKMESIHGPLSLLNKCIEEKIKVKIWTRHGHGIRGYITAFVTMFDKHWNMSLEEVTEIWTRPKKGKIPSYETVNAGKTFEDLHELDSCFPEVTVLKTEKKLETCRRQLDQLFVRGEHVVYIAILNEK